MNQFYKTVIFKTNKSNTSVVRTDIYFDDYELSDDTIKNMAWHKLRNIFGDIHMSKVKISGLFQVVDIQTDLLPITNDDMKIDTDKRDLIYEFKNYMLEHKNELGFSHIKFWFDSINERLEIKDVIPDTFVLNDKVVNKFKDLF